MPTTGKYFETHADNLFFFSIISNGVSSVHLAI